MEKSLTKSKCEHDWIQKERHDDVTPKGVSYYFYTYQCWKCQKWSHGDMFLEDGTVIEHDLP